MTTIPLIPPLGGLNDALGFSSQPRGTTTLARNTSSIDPATNRIRLGPRAGCVKHNENRLAPTGKVQVLTQCTSDNRRVTYAVRSNVSAGDLTDAETVTPSATNTVDGVADSHGNLYVLDGPASVLKLNSAFVEVWRFSLPVQSEAQVVRAICIDPFDNLYFGVSEGGEQAQALLWAYGADADKNLVLRWKKKTKAFIEQMVWQNNLLFTAQNDTDTNRAAIVAYEGADQLTAPNEAQRKPVRGPVGGLVVKPSGEVIATFPATSTAFYDPRVPQCTAILDEQRWNPTMLTEYEKRIHCWLSADTIEAQADNVGIVDGDPVRVWRDKSGKHRDLYQDTSLATYKPFTFVKTGLGMRPGVRGGGNFYRMISKQNAGVKESQKDVQGTIWPGYENCGYVMVMVVKPTENTQKERLFQQTNTVGGGSREIWINTDSSGGAAVSGAISNNQSLVAASGTDPSSDPADGYFTNQNSAAIITVISENNHIAAELASWRVNGVPLAQFVANNFTSGVGVKTVIGCQADGSNGFTGDIHEIFVLRDYTPTGGIRKLIESPTYDANKAGTNPAWNSLSDTEIERIEGYFAWKYGISHLLDDGSLAVGSGPNWVQGGGQSEYKHPFNSDDATQGPPNPGGRFADTLDIDQLYAGPISAKYSPQRMNVKWVNKGAGQGSGIALDSDGNFATIGAAYGGDGRTARYWTDAGTSVTNPWSTGVLDGSFNSVDYDYSHGRIAFDKYDNLYVPWHWTTGTPAYSMSVFSQSGSVLLSYALSHAQFGYSVIVPSTYPDYGTQVIDRPEFVYLLTRNMSTAIYPTVHKIKLVSNTVTQGSARSTKLLGVCNGSIVSFVAGDSPPTAITGGTNVLTAGAMVCAVQAASKVFFTDGTHDVYYDSATDQVHQWTSLSAGELPPRSRWMCLWNGRMVRVRGDDPHNWHMSAFDNPFDWDEFPPVVVATQAISGNNAEVGKARDIINTIIPDTDQRLIMGGDHTVNIMYGDPLVGGQIIEVSNETGIAFGPSWAFDDDGILYFFGSKGGVYRMKRGGKPEAMTGDTIDRRLMDVDFSTQYVELRWNSELSELWVSLMPYGAGGTQRLRWRWQKRVDAWHEDTSSNAQIQPTCMFVYDADEADDRVLVMGCEDGYVRAFSRTATSDDGYSIACYVYFPPIGGGDHEYKLGCPTITLAADQGGCLMEFFGADSADLPGEPTFSQELVAGRNETALEWVRGSHAWLKLSSGDVGSRWSYESGTAKVLDAGRSRVRG